MFWRIRVTDEHPVGGDESDLNEDRVTDDEFDLDEDSAADDESDGCEDADLPTARSWADRPEKAPSDPYLPGASAPVLKTLQRRGQ